jgi:hypothetical protein
VDRHIVRAKWLAPLLALALPLVLQAGALGQSVVINGVPLVTSRTPVTMGGSMLLPMRDVFEALQSEVKWFALEQKVMAIRGQTTIELWLGRTTATVNGVPMQLPVAPTLINGSTYVPLRFPAEAFGGTVEWQAATRTALINSPPPGGATSIQPPSEPAPPTTPPPPPPPPAPKVVEGTLLQVIAAPPTLVISVSGTGLAQAIPLGQTTAYARHAEGQPAQTATLQTAVAGDYAQVTLGADGAATLVDLTFGERAGTIAGIAENSVLLKDNTVLSLSPTVVVRDAAGQPLPLTSLSAGTQVLLRYQPASRTVWEIRLTQATQPPTPPTAAAQPKILVVGILNRSSILKGGDVLQVQLQGTPGGTARVRAPRLFESLDMAEVTPGLYQADFAIPEGTNERYVQLTGDLTVNQVQAPPTTTATRLTVDSQPPIITTVSPDPDSTVNNTSPTIQADFSEDRGTDINPASAKLSINEQPVTEDLDVTVQRLVHTPDNLPAGRTRVDVSIEDLAGNRAERTWYFSVRPANIITAASLAPQRPLATGDVLTVTMTVAQAGGQATFDLGDEHGILMRRILGQARYRGQYTVPAVEPANDVPVIVRYRDPNGVDAEMEVGRVNINEVVLPTALAITAPPDGTQVGDTIQVRGQAPPDQRVRVTITYKTWILTTIQGQIWQGVVTATPGGDWQTPEVGSKTLFGKANEYLIVAELLDAGNAVVATKQIKLVK